MASHSTPELARRQSSAAQLWTLYKGDRRIDCHLHVCDQPLEDAVELRVLRDGVWCAGGRFTATADALAHGEELLTGLLATGWILEEDR